MGVVKGSVILEIPSAGNYQVTMPESDLDVIGFAPLGLYGGTSAEYGAPPIVGIYIDASNIAYFPLPTNAGFTVRKYSPVHVKLKGTVLNLSIPYTPPNYSGVTILYGVPDGSEIEYSDLKGVVFSYVNPSTTASASGSIPVTFPSGNVKIRGILIQGSNAGGVGQVSFTTGTGNSLYLPFSSAPDPMDLPDNITALDLKSATVLTINYTIQFNASGTATLYGIIYYE